MLQIFGFDSKIVLALAIGLVKYALHQNVPLATKFGYLTTTHCGYADCLQIKKRLKLLVLFQAADWYSIGTTILVPSAKAASAPLG